MAACFSCGKELEAIDRIGRREVCPSCGSDLHCCRNCEFYDKHAYNECREPQAERVLEKDKSNFCDYFQLAAAPRGGKIHNEEAEAKKRLEGLFRKK